MSANIYLELTRQFNGGRLRAILSGGQAVVLHRLAIMSKDGDWILREDEEALRHVVSVLAGYGAHYRFGAPLDIRWLAGGWSSHLEFAWKGLRVRTDFVTRPPRLDGDAVKRLWREQEHREFPFVGAKDLVELKKTNREKDYAVIGELARRMSDADEQILCSRSARDLMELAATHPDKIVSLARRRPALLAVRDGVEALEAALDAERRRLMHANEERLAAYMAVAEPWSQAWSDVAREMDGMAIRDAHDAMVKRAEGRLPFALPGAPA
ncbi:MAG: hypothetical protein HY343_06720 [Lentisphaerae bacterium]|nr:hypothetical protein [Lentisphaerota bacterium]